MSETERVRAIQDKQASGYDRSMGFFERLLFKGAREWACGRLEGEVLEIAIGTGRNMRLYPAGVRSDHLGDHPHHARLMAHRARRTSPLSA